MRARHVMGIALAAALSGCSLSVDPDTGYSTCAGLSSFDGSGEICREWFQWTPPAEALPTTLYDTTTAGVVKDSVTGLTWQRVQAPSTYTAAEAETYCAELSLAGFTDWRLPTLAELVSIVDYSRSSPSINVTVFPGTATNRFATRTPVHLYPTQGWAVYFSIGHTGPVDLTIHSYVRCVR